MKRVTGERAHDRFTDTTGYEYFSDECLLERFCRLERYHLQISERLEGALHYDNDGAASYLHFRLFLAEQAMDYINEIGAKRIDAKYKAERTHRTFHI